MSFIQFNSDNAYSVSMSSDNDTELNTDPILTTNQYNAAANTVAQAAALSPTFSGAYLFPQMTVVAQPSPFFSNEKTKKTAEEELFELLKEENFHGQTFLAEALITGNAQPIREVTENIMPESRLEQPILQSWSDMRTAQDANLAEAIEINLEAIVAKVVKESSTASGVL